MIKLTDIARLADTSTSTVSKVLNDYPGVKEETRQRVMEAVKTLGYIPNASARQLITKKSYLVGLLFTESLDVGLEHPFYAGVIEAFRKTMNNDGYDVIFIAPGQNGSKMSYLDHCRYRNVDGVFVCTFAGNDEELKLLFESGIPCVTTDVVYRGIPLVTSDNILAAKEAYNYLYDCGHRDIAHIHGPLDTLAARERLQGYKDVLFEHHLHAKPELLVGAENFDYDSGRQALRELVRLREGKAPDAIIAASDIVALGIINELFRQGFRVPGDVSVIGFDNISLSEYSYPSLSTMGQDRWKVGNLTAQALIASIEGKKVHSRTLVSMTLIERSTTRVKI